MTEEDDTTWTETFSESDGDSVVTADDRVILHFDLDCFYAQVEALLDPSLAEVPFAVRQKQILITTNYAARAIGVPKNGLAAEILKNFPQLKVVCGEDLREYRRYSQMVHQAIKTELGPLCPVERLGMDENFADVTAIVDGKPSDSAPPGWVFGDEKLGGCARHARLAAGMRIANRVREKILNVTRLTSSAGIASNKLLSKLVGGCHKPGDQTALLPGDAPALMSQLKGVKSIPGIGHSTANLLKTCGVETLTDLKNIDAASLRPHFNEETARRLKELACGIDRTPVKMSEKAKTIGLEDRFQRIDSADGCKDKIKWLLGRLAELIADDGRAPKTIKVSVRSLSRDSRESRQCKVSPSLFSALKTTNSLSQDSLKELLDTCMGLLEKTVDVKSKFHLTMLGVSVGDLVEPVSADKSIAAFFGMGAGAAKPKRKAEQHLSGAGDSLKRSREVSGGGDVQQRCPDGWDEEVFRSLPVEIRQELLSSRAAGAGSLSPGEASKNRNKKCKNNSILNYVVKNK